MRLRQVASSALRRQLDWHSPPTSSRGAGESGPPNTDTFACSRLVAFGSHYTAAQCSHLPADRKRRRRRLQVGELAPSKRVGEQAPRRPNLVGGRVFAVGVFATAAGCLFAQVNNIRLGAVATEAADAAAANDNKTRPICIHMLGESHLSICLSAKATHLQLCQSNYLLASCVGANTTGGEQIQIDLCDSMQTVAAIWPLNSAYRLLLLRLAATPGFSTPNSN